MADSLEDLVQDIDDIVRMRHRPCSPEMAMLRVRQTIQSWRSWPCEPVPLVRLKP
jgi:hypothetical protein